MVLRTRRRAVPRIEEIEPRILFSADAAGLLADLRPAWERESASVVQQVELPSGTTGSWWRATHDNATTLACPDEHAAAGSLLKALAAEAPTTVSTFSTGHAREVVFIDGAVPHLDTLLDTLGPGVEKVVLDGASDGLQQMADYLQGRSGLGAIHLISEGASGIVHAGDRWINTDGLDAHADALARIGNALAPGGDVLLYGCRVGEGDAGAAFLTELSGLTGADVAASNDATGNARQGGNWLLERHTGAVEASSILTSQNASAYTSVLGVYAVTNTNDSGAGSLRQAILDANANAGQDTIVFNIGSGAKTITLSSTINVTDSVILDGTSQSGYASSPLITITGNGINADGLALRSGASGSTVKGLAINGFLSNLFLHSVSNVTVTGNYVGLNADGSTAGTNRGNGIYLLNSSSVTIGGTSAADRNVLSGNAGSGIFSESSSGNTIQGNYIGLAADGVMALANTSVGIYLHNGGSTLVGGTSAGAGNVIAGNSASGVFMQGSSGNTLQGNLIGLKANGTGAAANGSYGIYVMGGSSSNTIGGTSAAARNVISGNTNQGIALTDVTTTGNVVQGNYIGTNAAGTAAVANGWGGVLLSAGTTGNTIGGTAAGAGNVISGNTNEGIGLDAASANTLQGNLIGVAADGVTALANHTDGVYLRNASNNNVIGGTGVGARNLIANNQGDAIHIYNYGTASTGNSILCNSIYDNTGSAVVLSGTNPQDLGDVDGGPNNGQNQPVLTSATTTGGLTDIAGYIDTVANTTVRLEFFTTPATHTVNDGVVEGRTYLGFLQVTTDASGHAAFHVQFADASPYRQAISASATNLSSNDTSEFGWVLSNNLPVVATTGGTTAYVENGAGVLIDGGITVSDLDNTSLSSATVSITGNFVSGQDLLAFTNNGSSMGNIAASYDAATGVMTLISSGGSATLAEWQAALRAVTYANSSDNPGTASRTISFAVNDGSANSAAATRAVSVTGVNDAPVVTTAGGTTGYVENSAAVAIDTALSLSDLDSTALSTATVSITGNFVSGQDLLAFTNDGSTMGNIAASYDAATGVMTLISSGATATLTEWQAALRAVTYANSSDNPGTASRTISFAVNDGSAISAAATRAVSVTAVNDAPVVTSSGGTTGYVENSAAVAIDTALSLSDLDSTALSTATVSITGNFVSGQDLLAFTNNGSTMGNIAASYDAATGVMTLTSSGATATLTEWQAALRAVTYANSSDDPGTASRTISFAVNDGSANSAAATRTVSITAVNDAPVVTTAGGTTGYIENSAAVAIDTALSLSDLDSTALSTATVSITGNFVSGQDLLAFTNNGSTMGNIAASYDAATGVMTLTSSGATATLTEWQAALRAVTYDNRSDNPGTASRTISFAINDGSANSAAANRMVSITAVNDAPVVASSGGTTGYTENSAAMVIDTALALSDMDNLTLSSTTVSITGNFVSGQDLLAFTNNGSTMGNIAASYDAATGVMTLTSSGATATLTEWQAALRAVTYANSSDNPGTASRTISFAINDGSANSAAATRMVSITAVNDAPVVASSGGTTGYTENSAAIAIDTALTLSDMDNLTLSSARVSITGNFVSGQDLLAFTNNGSIMGNIAASYDAATGVITLSSSGATATLAEWQAALRAVTYANSSDNPGTASRTISFAVNDGSANSAAATRMVSITAVNDAPVVASIGGTTGYTANGVPVAIDTGLSISDADDTTLSTATVSITGNFASGQDTLAFANDGSTMGNIAGSYDAATGLLTLNSSGAAATLAEWQAALRAVTYANSSDNPSTGNRIISFVVNDGSRNSVAAVRTVQVSAASITPAQQPPAADAGRSIGDSAGPSATGPGSSSQVPTQVQALPGLPTRLADVAPTHAPTEDEPDKLASLSGMRPSATTTRAGSIHLAPFDPAGTLRRGEAAHLSFDFAGFDYASLLLGNDEASAGHAAVAAHWSVMAAGHRSAATATGDDGSPAEVEETAQTLQSFELTTMLVAGGAGIWSLRMSGLVGMLFASRPLWKELDPIALLPAPEDAEPEGPVTPATPDDREAEAEMAAAELLDGVGHPGDNA